MKNNEGLQKFAKINENQRKSMESDENSWKSVKNLGTFQNINGNRRKNVKIVC